MKTKEIIKRAHEFTKPFRVTKGKNFRLKDIDPNDTLDFTKEADKARSKEVLATGVWPSLNCRTNSMRRTSGLCC